MLYRLFVFDFRQIQNYLNGILIKHKPLFWSISITYQMILNLYEILHTEWALITRLMHTQGMKVGRTNKGKEWEK
jgi:hypothetical protein